VRFARTVLGGRIVPLRRLLIGEALRFPNSRVRATSALRVGS
jgi:hypothetical protein